jgi:hypothetical protein
MVLNHVVRHSLTMAPSYVSVSPIADQTPGESSQSTPLGTLEPLKRAFSIAEIQRNG